MKLKALVAAIVFGAGWICASAQSNSYIIIDETVFDKAVDDVIKERKITDEKDKSFHREIAKTAFKKYTSKKEVKAKDIYEKSDIERLNNDIKLWKDSVKTIDGKLKASEKKCGELQKQIDAFNIEDKIAEAKKVWDSEQATKDAALDDSIKGLLSKIETVNNAALALNNDLAAKDTEIARLNAQLGEKDGVIAAKDQEIAALSANTKIAENVLEQYNARLGKIEKIYSEIINSSSFGYTDWPGFDKAVADYKEYANMIGQPIDPELQNKITSIEKIKNFSDFYSGVIAYFADKYNAKKNAQLINDFGNYKKNLSVLNEGQQTIFLQLEKALDEYPMAINNFNAILELTTEDGQVYGGNKAEIMEKVNNKLKLFAKSKGLPDLDRYNPLYTNLNKVLKNLKGSINKGISETEIKNGFATKIKAEIEQ